MHRRCNGVKLDTLKEPAYGVYYIAWQIVIMVKGRKLENKHKKKITIYQANIPSLSVIRFTFVSLLKSMNWDK